MYGGRPCHYEKYSNNAAASHAHESELWLAFYILWLVSHKTRFFERLGVGCRSPPLSVWIRPQHRTKTSKEPVASYKEVRIGKTLYRVTSVFSGEKDLGRTLEQLAVRRAMTELDAPAAAQPCHAS